MKIFKVGDLVKLSLHGRMSIGSRNITDKIGIVLRDNSTYANIILVKWLATGRTSETHASFIEKLEQK